MYIKMYLSTLYMRSIYSVYMLSKYINSIYIHICYLNIKKEVSMMHTCRNMNVHVVNTDIYVETYLNVKRPTPFFTNSGHNYHFLFYW